METGTGERRCGGSGQASVKSCCSKRDEAPALGESVRDEIALASREVGSGLRQTELSVPGIHCGGCIARIERALSALPGVEHARVNLSTKRVTVRWREAETSPPLLAALKDLGYDAHLHDPGTEEKDPVLTQSLRALAVAGFAAGNIMLLSVSVWSGAEPATRDLFHWISALIAFPTLIYSGRIFYRSAWAALRRGQTNMDVPISIGISLAFAMSLYDTIQGGEHAYFDAAVSLLFFLLIGRTLDHVMRERARTAVKGLARLAARGALVLRGDGRREYLPVDDIRPGMAILLPAGERVPVDAVVESGASDLDCSIVSGESAPQPVSPGAGLQAGTLNLTGPLTIRATATVKDSFLAEMVRLMEAAESGRAGYRRIADRAARLYAPVVHLAAFLTFVGWLMASGDVHRALTVAIAVLIITCPCALGLAVPMVQVMAARRLFENGIMVKDGSAMERLAEADTAIFDKTGTLTLGTPSLTNAREVDPAHLALASALAAHSRHPHSLALAAAEPAAGSLFDSVSELPGRGLEGRRGGSVFRLGRADWALGGTPDGEGAADHAGTVLSQDSKLLAAFRFDDKTRPGAAGAVTALKAAGFEVEIVSGDRVAIVEQFARSLGIERSAGGVPPGGKAARIAELAASGRKVLMVGDGLNDAPALAAAHVSMAPASAADVGRNAADFVFLRQDLEAVPVALSICRSAGRLIRQNFGLAALYNLIAMPIAILGGVTPLVAALAMSLSSVVVIANSLRLRGPDRRRASADAANGRASAPFALEPAG